MSYEKPCVKRYWPNMSPFINPVYEYININKDRNLRKMMTNHFYDKINSSKKVSHKIIYSLLKRFVNKSGINWYDLKDNNDLIIKYLYKKLE
jgi:hypothetical protein